MLLELLLAGQNPTRVKILRNSPLLLLKMLRRSVAYLLWNYERNQFELAFSVVLYLTVECLTVPLWYKQLVTFLNPKFD